LNTVIKGVVYLDNAHREMPVLIAKNTFDTNGAFYSTSGIFVRAYTETGKSAITGIPNAESDL
jgi:hypothetical protein